MEQNSTTVPNDDIINKKYLKKKDYVTFSLATFASSAVTGLVQGYLLFFYTVILVINPIAVGTMFLLTKIFDGLNDPIMGVIVDKTHTKWGKMRPYLMFGAVPFGIITILMFLPVTGFSEVGKVAWMYATYLLFSIVGTVVGVPLQGLPAVVSPNTLERTKVISISRILGSIGEQSALVLISLGLLFTTYKATYVGSAVIIGTLAPIFMVLAAINMKERLKPTEHTPRLMDGFKYIFKNKQFMLLILSNLLTFFRNLVSAAILYVVTYIFHNGSLQIWFALPGAVASMLGMLLAPKLKRRMDAKQLFIVATIWHSLALAIVFIVGPIYWWLTAALMFIAMMPVGILNVVPHLMATDTLDYWEDLTGQRQEGVTFSLMSLRSKVSSGFKDFFLSFLLAYFLFSAPLAFLRDHKPVQTEYTKNGLFLIYTLIPAVLNLASIIPMLFYKLSGKKMTEIQSRLAVKRLAEGVIDDDDVTAKEVNNEN